MGRSSPPSGAIRPDRQRFFVSGALGQGDRLSVVGLIRRSHVLKDDGSAQRFGIGRTDPCWPSLHNNRSGPRMEAAPVGKGRLSNSDHSNDAPTRMVRRGYFGANLRRSRRAPPLRSEFLFSVSYVRSRQSVGNGSSLWMEQPTLCGKPNLPPRTFPRRNRSTNARLPTALSIARRRRMHFAPHQCGTFAAF
jgi:hypothetical protein